MRWSTEPPEKMIIYGAVIHQLYIQLEKINHNIQNCRWRSQKIFVGDDPIQWYKNNNYSAIIESSMNKEFYQIEQNYNKCFVDLNNDPIFTM